MSSFIIADGQYRVVTGQGDYFVTVSKGAITIDAAIGVDDGDYVEWTQEDYGRVFSAPFQHAWIPLGEFGPYDVVEDSGGWRYVVRWADNLTYRTWLNGEIDAWERVEDEDRPRPSSAPGVEF